jgi:hypothetical protein
VGSLRLEALATVRRAHDSPHFYPSIPCADSRRFPTRSGDFVDECASWGWKDDQTPDEAYASIGAGVDDGTRLAARIKLSKAAKLSHETGPPHTIHAL